jgi:hypothetical protein
MPLNAALVGKVYPAIAFPLVADRIAAFAAAVGHPGGGVPPTFATVPELATGLTNVLADPDLGLELSRVLHGEQDYAWARALGPEETITAESTIEEIRARAGIEFLTIRTELRDEGGDVVVEARSKLIVRGGE